MSAAGGAGSEPDPAPARTLEEQRRRAHDQRCLVAALFDLQAVPPDADGLSAAACAALSALYRAGESGVPGHAGLAAGGAVELGTDRGARPRRLPPSVDPWGGPWPTRWTKEDGRMLRYPIWGLGRVAGLT